MTRETKADFGGVEVLVRFDYYPEQAGGTDHPDSPAEVCITEVQIAGTWFDESLFSNVWLEDTSDVILDSRGDEYRQEEAERQWEAQQERLMEDGFP